VLKEPLNKSLLRSITPQELKSTLILSYLWHG
jgi:hypothetical protein